MYSRASQHCNEFSVNKNFNAFHWELDFYCINVGILLPKFFSWDFLALNIQLDFYWLKFLIRIILHDRAN